MPVIVPHKLVVANTIYNLSHNRHLRSLYQTYIKDRSSAAARQSLLETFHRLGAASRRPAETYRQNS